MAEIKVNVNVWQDIIKELVDTGNGNNINSVTRRLILAANAYNIWYEKNRRIIKDTKRSSDEVFESIVEVVKSKLIGLTVKDSCTVRKMESKWMISCKRTSKMLSIMFDLQFGDSL
nr:RNA-directed DNA polymerase, eukaryota, reverse transcriptase zinc-binding domain protein [Tanacetum cinerariifolium]